MIEIIIVSFKEITPQDIKRNKSQLAKGVTIHNRNLQKKSDRHFQTIKDKLILKKRKGIKNETRQWKIFQKIVFRFSMDPRDNIKRYIPELLEYIIYSSSKLN